MNKFIKFNLSVFLIVCVFYKVNAQSVTDLRSMGYAIFPAPQKVDLENKNILIDDSWQVRFDKSVPNKITSSFAERVQELHSLKFSGQGSGKIELRVNKEAVKGIANLSNSKQAYKITISDGSVRIEGNDETGLFYGVQSFIQLMKPTPRGKFQLPLGTITDWPDLELRFIHWDTKHHRDKVATLKRYIDWSAYFKINAIAFEIEDKYEYPSHPIIGSPDAFTKEEMQELTKYALDRFIQLVPNVQAPAHMAYVLKHKEFEHLKADHESNYQACMCNDEAMELIFDMYQDMIDATPGVDYFFVSTDEVYYAGICGECKNEYNEENRSKAWVEYLQRVNKWMKERNRRVLAWVEYPLLPKDISKVPSDVIDAIMGPHKTKEWSVNETKAGIDQLSYSSMQGAEYLFPNYFSTKYRNRQINGRLSDAYRDISNREGEGANLIGTFAAAWDDAGLHSETFWLGWATVTQYGWTKNTPSLQQNIIDFMDLFYGMDSPDMVETYVGLQEGARFYEDLWERKESVERTRGYGNSKGKGVGGEMQDLLIDPLMIPSAKDLSVEPVFTVKYAEKINEATVLLEKNQRLILHLIRNITRVRHNSYNLEVLLSIALLERYTMNMVINLAKVEDYLVRASKADSENQAVSLLVEAHQLSGKILQEQNEMWKALNATWGKSRLAKGAGVGGKDFLHVYDDVKDHFADRRKGLEYMLAPFERMGIEDWRKQLSKVITDFSELHNIPVTGLEAERLED
ncbi:glycoside hydrolase family 20 zincin-like fold domain-containing protein [Reichenbachiella sp. MALMAid0571]|uniref:glycoside hydrolase family 20 zincin-like fold domain-containing protein n=1 Tax=Reichenbachiella sp. MALMAid0571 TaxID=3143939 RepID=UPI0032DEBF66